MTLIARGPEHVEYRYYEALVLVDILHLVKEAESQGFDAAVICTDHEGIDYDALVAGLKLIVDARNANDELSALDLTAGRFRTVDSLVQRAVVSPAGLPKVVLVGLPVVTTVHHPLTVDRRASFLVTGDVG